ncbi:hypothetical protein F8M41_026341 [Gigaspora margarita]|uniref:Uncharacterized protein n=1 Tax=Gigaspora margarita TaxID=4874 RepID=A0A8H4ET00_GIGMA|nr:hypothetical protein F8M41_026341 [Gigaspora margarita]
MKLKSGVDYCQCCLVITLSLMLMTCPILQLAKIVAFNKAGLHLSWIDHFYLILLIILIITILCLACNLHRDDPSSAISIALLVIIMVFILTWYFLLYRYTRITHYEMDIPLLCPAEYNYTSPLVKSACQIRSANLVFMWITGVIFALPFLFALLVWYLQYCPIPFIPFVGC